jgi:hypothetical protein
MTIELRFVDTLPATAKGKRQFIINKDKELLAQCGYSSG